METAVTGINGITLAVINVVSLIALSLITQWFLSHKEQAAARQILDLNKQTAELKRAEKEEDWRRQDEVAEKASVAAALLLKAQRETIARTDEVARVASESGKAITAKLDEGLEQGKKIHTLVNSDMTAARTSERDTMQLLVLALKRLSKGEEDQDEIVRFEKRIEELNVILADRIAAQKKVDADTAAAKKGS